MDRLLPAAYDTSILDLWVYLHCSAALILQRENTTAKTSSRRLLRGSRLRRFPDITRPSLFPLLDAVQEPTNKGSRPRRRERIFYAGSRCRNLVTLSPWRHRANLAPATGADGLGY